MISKYGKSSEVVNAHIQKLISLPHINSVNLYKINEFTDKLLECVRTLEAMGKLKEISGYVKLTLDKLQGIRADLVRMNNEWQQ